MSARPTVDFYFDFISPYAYLASLRLKEIESLGVSVRLRPILFAGLLNHHGQKGPAEIAPKRTHTYRQVLWLAKQMQVPLVLPSAHPFNPLPLLRLQLAAGNTSASMASIFQFVWEHGRLPSDPEAWQQLLAHCQCSDSSLEPGAVKAAIRTNTEEALHNEVFGVPCFRVAGENFWGLDCIDMLKAFLANDPFFTSPPWYAAEHLPVGASRT